MKTKRLIIRRFTPEDWQDLFEYLSQETVVKYEPYEVFTEEASKQEAVRRSEDNAFWAVCLEDSGKLIGNIYLSKLKFDTWELGYVFNAKYQGMGYATEAARAVVDDAIRSHNARRIIAMCNSQNEPSWRLLERLGMRREGHLLQDSYFKRDSAGCPIWHDTYEYGILATEWSNHTLIKKNIYSALVIFPTPDINRTSDFYVNVMGFRAVKYLDVKEPHICLYRDDIEVVLTKSKNDKVYPNRELYGYGEDAYFITDEQETLLNEFTEKGVKIVRELRLTDYNNREFTVEDIDGRWIAFGIKEK